MPPENLSDLLGRVSKNSTGEIDSLIGDFEQLRRKLQTDGERIQRDIEEYTALSQPVMQFTKVISESMDKFEHQWIGPQRYLSEFEEPADRATFTAQ